jgi:DNA (cytosine-5)-methyltransferase 1
MLTCGALFAGAGGLCSGFARAGFEALWASDIDQDVKTVHQANFPKTDFILSDIRFLDLKRLVPVDVIHAGFPCNSFSQAGQRKGFEDPRGESCLVMLSLLARLQSKPKILVFENSPYLLSGDSGKWFDRLVKEIRGLGFLLTRDNVISLCPYRDLGQPQSRERIFIFAVNSNYFDWNPFRKLSFLPNPKKIESLIKWEEEVDGNHYLHDSNKYHAKLNKFFQETTENIVVQWRIDKARPQPYGRVPTLTANMGNGGHNIPFIKTKKGIRKLTIDEVARLQGFSSDFFNYLTKKNSIYRMIGNAVHVDVAEVIAKNVKDKLVKR